VTYVDRPLAKVGLNPTSATGRAYKALIANQQCRRNNGRKIGTHVAVD
jgi:hypothetical protein